MSESFAELFEESLKDLKMAPGSIVAGTVVAIENDFVMVHAGLKSEGFIPREQFEDENGELTIAVGDTVQVALESVEDGFGATMLSREKAKRAESWIVLEQAFENDEIVKGIIVGKVRGGFTVDLNTVLAFLPGSLVDIRPTRDTAHLEGVELEFKLVKLDAKRNNIVVSRRAVLEASYNEERDKLLSQLEEGVVVKGVVKNLTDYGAFIDLGGLDGLLHITDIAWRRVRHPSEVLNVGDEISVKVLKFDTERRRVSLGLKQLSQDPWQTLAERHAVGSRSMARVTNVADFGCFAEIEAGIEGLVHVSEMDWTNKNVHPSKVVQVGDEIEVMVLDIDTERRRISLGMKQCRDNPWQAFANQFNKGDVLTGKIRSITDFGVFIGLDGGIDGLVHLSDLSWDLPSEQVAKTLSKGDELTAVLLSIDTERERIALSVKQLAGDPFGDYVAQFGKGAQVKGIVTGVDEKQVTLQLADGVSGQLRAADTPRDRSVSLTTHYKTGDEIEATVINVDRRNRSLQLSQRPVKPQAEQPAMKAVKDQPAVSAGPTTIGDLIKAQMSKSND